MVMNLSRFARLVAATLDRTTGRKTIQYRQPRGAWFDPRLGVMLANYYQATDIRAIPAKAVLQEIARMGGAVQAEDLGLIVFAHDLTEPAKVNDVVILDEAGYQVITVNRAGVTEDLVYKLQLRQGGNVQYFVDSLRGDDSALGTSPETAWRSPDRVAQGSYLPGDQILFAKGRVFRGQIQIGASGSTRLPLVLGAYDPPDGATAAPSLRGSDNVSANNLWRNGGGNLWYLSGLTQDPVVFSHDGVLGQRKLLLADLAVQWDYFFEAASGRLYVYSTQNPGWFGEVLEAAVRDYVLGPTWTEHVQMEGFDLRHGRVETWIGWGGGHYEFKNCLFTQSGGQHLQAHNGFDSLSVLSCDFDDWNVGDGHCYAVQAIGGAGPVDVEGCFFRATRPTTVWDHTAIMSDDRGWVRTVKKCSFQDFSGDGMVIWRPKEDADTILLEDLSFQNVGGNNIVLQELEHYGATPTVRVRRVPIKNACWRDGLDNHALRLRSISAACDLQLEYVAVDGTVAGINGHPAVQIMNVAGARLDNFTLADADDGIEVLEASAIWDPLLSQWVSGIAVGGLNVQNTILAGNRGYGVKAQNSGWFSQFDFNCLFSNALGDYLNVSAGEHDLLSDPLLYSATSNLPWGAGSSYAKLMIPNSSPCHLGGQSLGLTKDIDWAVLPDGAPDIGAFQAAA